MRCRTAQTWIVAARDGELTERHRRTLDRHLAECGACRAEQVSLEGVLAALDALEPAREVPARLEADVLRQVRGLAADGAAPTWTLPQWVRRGFPAIAATAVVALAVVGVRSSEVAMPDARTKTALAERPRVTAPATPAPAVAKAEAPVVARRAKVRAPAEPPAELASRPDLFVDLPMIRELEKMQHFDAIAAEDSDGGEAPSPNG